MYSFWDMQADRQTDMLIAILCPPVGGEVITWDAVHWNIVLFAVKVRLADCLSFMGFDISTALTFWPLELFQLNLLTGQCSKVWVCQSMVPIPPDMQKFLFRVKSCWLGTPGLTNGQQLLWLTAVLICHYGCSSSCMFWVTLTCLCAC